MNSYLVTAIVAASLALVGGYKLGSAECDRYKAKQAEALINVQRQVIDSTNAAAAKGNADTIETGKRKPRSRPGNDRSH